MSFCLFFKLFYLFSLFFFWLRQVLVAVRGIFVEACRIFRCGVGSSLWRVGFSLVVARGFSLSSCDVWVPGCVGSEVCSTRALSLRGESSVVVAQGLIALRHVGS